MKLLSDYNLTEEQINKLVHRFNILKDKVNFGICFNDIDKQLLEIIEEYDFIIPYIDKENKNRNKNH